MRTTAARRLSPAVVVALSAVLLVLAAAPAGAAGTGGIEVTPDPAVVDGVTVTNFVVDVPSRGELVERFVVRNITEEPRTARLYTAEVRDVDGNLQVGAHGSSPYAVLTDQEVTLQPGEVRAASFTIRGGDLPDDEAMAAVVVEVSNGGSVVQRAATMVYLERGRQVPLPLVLVVVAVVLVASSAAAWAASTRRSRRSAVTA